MAASSATGTPRAAVRGGFGLVFIAAVALTTACASGSRPGNADDAGVVGPGDASALDGAAGTGFGDPCTVHSDCAEGICYRPDLEDPMGTCSRECTGMCPDGYACQLVQIADFTDARVCVPALDTLCKRCEVNADCGDSRDFCVALSAGKYCTIDCASDPTVCPAGFACQTVAGTGDTVVGKQCMPLNGVCCVDADNDQRGIGDACANTDCDDANPAVYDDAAEVCDGFDNDCVGGIDLDPIDCAQPSCQLGAFGYFARAAEPCDGVSCQSQAAQNCGLYTCADGDEAGDSCATACEGEVDLKCVPTAHCDASVCEADYADGLACNEDSDCSSSHCQNGFCCAFGDCCQVASNCPTFGSQAAICEDPATCQGQRGEAVCTTNYTCATNGTAQDDSACGPGTAANDCGWYLSAFCNGGLAQTPPTCPSSCASNADCDAAAHCDPNTNTCIEDLLDGSVCGTDAGRCKSGHCQNGFCCATGDCCTSELDCPPSYSSSSVCTVPTACQGLRDVAQCNASICSTTENAGDDSACGGGVLASDCNTYKPLYCNGAIDQSPPLCPTSCNNDSQCDASAYCNGAGVCVPDQPNGGVCLDNAECASNHCQNGYCCDSGNCCSVSSNCDFLDLPSACTNAVTCQGQRTDGVCSASKQCEVVVASDDSGCSGLTSSDCGPYPAKTCSAAQSQTPPVCAQTCSSDNDCDVSAHCDGSVCVPDLGQGGFCDEPTDCSGGLFCVDNVCCNTSCNGACEACDLAGSVGTCKLVPSGQDPDTECGAVTCAGFFAGWTGDSCLAKADVSAAAATCNGSGACKTAAQECGAQSQTAGVQITCNDLCQDPLPATCTGSIAGACSNVTPSPSTQSCGVGACARTVNQCNAGVPVTCVPGTPTTETCNNLDDDCDSLIDNNASFEDISEPNGTCGTITTLPTVGSDGLISITDKTIYGAGDNDYYRINAKENDSSCECCNFLCTDEDFRLKITLTVPAGAGSYYFCDGAACSTATACVLVAAGNSHTKTLTYDGGCPGTDEYNRYVRIYGGGAPGFECLPYQLSYQFTPGCF